MGEAILMPTHVDKEHNQWRFVFDATLIQVVSTHNG
jgi:hypothetical protein